MRSIGSVVGGYLALIGIAVSVAHAQPSKPSGAPDKAAVAKVVNEICSDGGAWLKCYSLEPSDCVEITISFVEPCIKTVFANSSKDPAVHPITTLLGCFNREFMRKYGHGEVKTPECATPMKHLMGPGK
jgi:hypothetical protein